MLKMQNREAQRLSLPDISVWLRQVRDAGRRLNRGKRLRVQHSIRATSPSGMREAVEHATSREAEHEPTHDAYYRIGGMFQKFGQRFTVLEHCWTGLLLRI
jgi:hypothetical protein